MTLRHREQEAISMLKSKKFQPNQIALRTGLSLTWVELQARKLGLVPLTVQKAVVRSK